MELSNLSFVLKSTSPQGTVAHAQHTSPSPARSGRSAARVPHVVLFGGQDSPSEERLARCWHKSCQQLLPNHRLQPVAWPAGGAARKRRSAGGAPPATHTHRKQTQARSLFPAALEGPLARGLTAAMAYLDAHMQLDAEGTPRGLPSRLVHHFSRFSIEAMYNRDGRGDALVAHATEALGRAPVDLLVAHSFGGTLALRAAWELWRRGERTRRFTLITLGTGSGPTVAHSPMLSVLPRTSLGQIARLPNLHAWHHFWSPTDVLVGASMLPREFEGVSLHRVDTGPLSPRAHALSSYLAVPEVVHRVRSALSR